MSGWLAAYGQNHQFIWATEKESKISSSESQSTDSWYPSAVLLRWGGKMSQWPHKFEINESHISFFVIAALLLEKQDIKGGEDAQLFCRGQTRQKISCRKNRFLGKKNSEASVSQSRESVKKCSALWMFLNARQSKDSLKGLKKRISIFFYRDLSNYSTYSYWILSWIFLSVSIVPISAALPSDILVIYSLWFSPS